jgi:hypothetical protein
MRNGGPAFISATANVNPAAIQALHGMEEADADDQQAKQTVTRDAFGNYQMIAAEGGHRNLRERSGVADAAAPGRTHGRAGKDARRNQRGLRLYDAILEVLRRVQGSGSGFRYATPH